MKYDGDKVPWGDCRRATLNVIVNTCPIDENGSPLPNCIQKATLTSSFGNPLTFSKTVTPKNFQDFFSFPNKTQVIQDTQDTQTTQSN